MLVSFGQTLFSSEYNKATSLVNMADLADEYELNGNVGDQEWLNLLGWSQPELFYVLPCQFNYQNTRKCYAEYPDKPRVCEIFTKCDVSLTPVKIIHKNSVII